jgi:hypothetical protein
MSDKFKEVTIDRDTKIMFRKETKLGKYDVLYENWIWESVMAETFIFANEDIEDLTDDGLVMLVKSSNIFKIGSSVLVKRSESGYTFVNFNFEVR